VIAPADVGIAVSDAKASARWWEENVGFRTFTMGGSGHAILVAPPGERFVLHLCEGFEKVDPGNTGVAFITDEIDAVVARMTKGGVTFAEPIKKQSWGGKSGKFADPDGNVFWIMEAPRKMIRETMKNIAPEGTRAKPAQKAAKRAKAKAPRKSSKRARTASRSRR